MIDNTIEKYDQKQEARHRENTTKLDRNADAVGNLKDAIALQFKSIERTISESTGGRKLIAWGIPGFVAILSVIAEILRH